MAEKIVYLSLGSNMGDREESLRTAVGRLEAHDFHIRKVSSVYETAPMYVKNQSDFLNLVLEASTTLFPKRLLLRISSIERELGRRRVAPNGPRTIDIDIVLFGRFVVDTPELQIPHPRFTERRFVLEPLIEIAPDLRHPVTKQPLRELLASAPRDPVRKTSIPIFAPGDKT
jgi:2-amino-4-hydroxy-6-hydroxymethyldihydropteridine diphosphokinase